MSILHPLRWLPPMPCCNPAPVKVILPLHKKADLAFKRRIAAIVTDLQDTPSGKALLQELLAVRDTFVLAPGAHVSILYTPNKAHLHLCTDSPILGAHETEQGERVVAPIPPHILAARLFLSFLRERTIAESLRFSRPLSGLDITGYDQLVLNGVGAPLLAAENVIRREFREPPAYSTKTHSAPSCWSPLRIAAFFQATCRLEEQTGTPLDGFLGAAHAGDIALAERFLIRGADLEGMGECEMTAVHFAASRGHVPMLRFLEGEGASLAKAANGKMTAMHFAAWWGDPACLEFLKERGLDPLAEACDGLKPLHCAILRGNTQAAAWCLEQGATVDQRTFRALNRLRAFLPKAADQIEPLLCKAAHAKL
jgi:hypothetical protein